MEEVGQTSCLKWIHLMPMASCQVFRDICVKIPNNNSIQCMTMFIANVNANRVQILNFVMILGMGDQRTIQFNKSIDDPSHSRGGPLLCQS